VVRTRRRQLPLLKGRFGALAMTAVGPRSEVRVTSPSGPRAAAQTRRSGCRSMVRQATHLQVSSQARARCFSGALPASVIKSGWKTWRADRGLYLMLKDAIATSARSLIVDVESVRVHVFQNPRCTLGRKTIGPSATARRNCGVAPLESASASPEPPILPVQA